MDMDKTTQLLWNQFSQNRFKTEKSKQTYYGDICQFLNYTQKPITQITNQEVSNYYNYCIKLISNNKIKRSTLLKKFRELSKFSSFLIEERENLKQIPSHFKNNFESYVTALSIYEKEKVDFVPNVDLMDELLKTAENNLLYYTIISLVYRTGIRPLEVCKIKQSDLFEDPSGTYLKVKRDEETRIIWIPEDIRTILDLYLKERISSTAFLFVNHLGNPLNERYLERMMEELTKKANIRHFTLFDVRNAASALMFAYGASGKQVAKQQGITEFRIQRYNEVLFDEDIMKFANKLVKIRIDTPRTSKQIECI